MARKGFLTPKTFFPKTGDVFINSEDDEQPLWECKRANQWTCDKTGTKLRYTLIVNDHEEMGPLPHPNCPTEGTDMERWLSEYDAVHRGGREYRRTQNGTFVEP